MVLEIHLLGSPRIEHDGEPATAPRGNKAWGLLAYLALSRIRRPSRDHLAGLLFDTADDPLGSLRWNLAELRRALGSSVLPAGSTELELPPERFLDAEVLASASAEEAIAVPGLGRELLEGVELSTAPAFESWLLAERRRLVGAAEAALHDAALDRLAAGEAPRALELARRLVEMNPYEENFQELLIRSYAESGDRDGAQRQLATCVALLTSELEREPGPALARAAEATPPSPPAESGGRHAAEASLEAGRSAISAGAFETGTRALVKATDQAHACGERDLEARALLALGTALVHSARGRDEEGAAKLLRAASLGVELGSGDLASAAKRELAYLDALQARYARCTARLEDAAALAESDEELAGVEAILGLVAGDTGAHDVALAHLNRSVELAEAAGSARQAAFSLSFAGRSQYLCERFDEARTTLDRSLELASGDDWLAFTPWPEAWLAEVEAAAGEREAAKDRFEHAYALGCELGDPCWQGMAGQGLGRMAYLDGEIPQGLRRLEESRRQAGSLPDAYVWIQAYALAGLAAAAVEASSSRAREWVGDLASLATRTGMRELAVRAALLRAALGERGAVDSATVLVNEVENPALLMRVNGLRAAVTA